MEPTARLDGNGAPVIVDDQNGDGHLRRGTTVDLPMELATWTRARCESENSGLGDVIVFAIEDGASEIQRRIKPRTVGGDLFAVRHVEEVVVRPEVTATSTCSFRLLRRDFADIDQLVEDWGASSRSHLIRVALETLRHKEEQAKENQ